MTTWHAPTDVLARFARHPESVDDITASSIEQHLMTCDDCRRTVASAADPLEVRRSWDELADAIDQPRHTLLERALIWFGMPTDLARVVGATPGLRLAWLVTAALVAAAAVAAARDTSSDTAFLVVAPLVPLGAVLLAFLPAEEPGGEAATATPLHGAPLVLRRVVTILAPTFVVLVVAGLAQPQMVGGGALWVLPGLALALAALALSTWMRAVTATASLAAAWVLLIAGVAVLDGRPVPIAETPVFGVAGQAVALATALVATAGVYTRRDSLSIAEVTR